MSADLSMGQLALHTRSHTNGQRLFPLPVADDFKITSPEIPRAAPLGRSADTRYLTATMTVTMTARTPLLRRISNHAYLVFSVCFGSPHITITRVFYEILETTPVRFLRKPTSARPATSQPLPLMRWFRFTHLPSAVQKRPLHYNRDRLLVILTLIPITYCSTWADKLTLKLTEILTVSQINVGIFISLNSVQVYQYLFISLVYRVRFSLKFMRMNFPRILSQCIISNTVCKINL